MTTLWIEPFGGLAGDMLLAALLDLGDERFGLEHLRELARVLVPGECALEARPVTRHGLRATHLSVRTPETEAAPVRHLSDLLALLEGATPAGLPAAAAARAAEVLRRLGEAEARVHGIALEAVHFHEVGAVDTLIDVAGAALALERLGVREVRATTPYVGGGTVRCAHGEMPVPAPATLELLGARPFVRGAGGERLTPTAAAILAVLAPSDDSPPGGSCTTAVGYGAGTRDPDEGPPNLCRVSLAAAATSPAHRPLLEGATNLDDVTGEELADLAERLRAAGARDVWAEPATMKKGRPGTVLRWLAESPDRERLERELFDHSPTLGVRWTRVERRECPRVVLEVDLDGEPVRVKVRVRPDRALERRDLSPEFDDLARLARASRHTTRELERLVVERALADATLLERARAQAR